MFPKADNQIRTGDLILTKDALYLLSYISTDDVPSKLHIEIDSNTIIH